MTLYIIIGILYVMFCLWQSYGDTELQPKNPEEGVYFFLMIGAAFLLWPLWASCDLYFWYND